MTQLDLFYRSFRDYVKELQKDRETVLLKDAVVRSDETDEVSVIRTVCAVDEDWVEAIERGLVFVGKAIGEERQFIRSKGEVAPIEKVKHVSRESVEHLARHSNLITREQTGDDILPDQLYTVERLNDYTVYENRFLYMLLCKLRDFIGMRYNKIIKLTNTYSGTSRLRKKVVAGKTRLEYEVNFKESREDDWYLRNHNSASDALERLELMQRSVYYYLRTPLMTEVAKADKLKPPITKTNVLRMDKNFKEVVALYDFISSYNKDGYIITQEERRLDPIKDSIAEEFADPMLLLSFLTYEHGLGLEEYLEAEFEKEEAKRKEEAARLETERLLSLKKRIEENGESPEQYILMLEKRNRELEQDSRQLLLAREEIKGLRAETEALNGQIAALNEEMAAREEEHAKVIEMYEQRIETLGKEQAEEAALHAEALVQAEREKREKIARVKAEADNLVRESEARCDEKQHEVDLLAAEMASLKKEDILLRARLTALRKEHGLLTDMDDYTSEEAFTELEKEFEALGELVRGEWKEAKQLLRRDFLHTLKQMLTGKTARPRRNKDAENAQTEENQKSGAIAESKNRSAEDMNKPEEGEGLSDENKDV